MQKNEVKGCCQAEANEEQEEKGQRPLTNHFKNAPFLLFAFRLPFFYGFFFASSWFHFDYKPGQPAAEKVIYPY